MRDALAALRPPDARHEAPRRDGRPKALNALGVLARHPALTKAFNTFNGHVLFGSTLSSRERELLILRVAAQRQSDYEWAQHTVLGQDSGLDVEEIRRVVVGPDAEGLPEHDRTLLRAADELVAEATITDETWAALADVYDEQQLLDLVFTVGAYDTLAMAFRCFGIELDADLLGHEMVVAMAP